MRALVQICVHECNCGHKFGCPLRGAIVSDSHAGRKTALAGRLQIKFGLRRHGTHTAGSDGTIDGKLVEVKTISPEKASDRVLVKSQGDFEQLLIVRIDRDFQFKGKLVDRNMLKGVGGKFLRGRLNDDMGNT